MTPANLKSARKALGKSMQGLAEDLGYSGKHAWKNIQLMENGTRPIPHRFEEQIWHLLGNRQCDITVAMNKIEGYEPTGAPHSEKWSLTGVVGSPAQCAGCGVEPAPRIDVLCASCRARREHTQ